jgi:hypothetical protein
MYLSVLYEVLHIAIEIGGIMTRNEIKSYLKKNFQCL